jgi:hypothetical protein
MNKDAHLIYEAYTNKLLVEAPPVEMSGDVNVEPVTKKTIPGQGKKYGGGAITAVAQQQGKSEEDVTQDMAKTIIAKAQDKKEVDGKMVHYFSGEPDAFIESLVPEFEQKYGIKPTMARYTINYLLIYVLNAKKTPGGLIKLSTKNISNPEALPDQPTVTDMKFPSADEGYGPEFTYIKNKEVKLEGKIGEVFNLMPDEVSGDDMSSVIKRNMIQVGIDKRQFWDVVTGLIEGRAFFEKKKEGTTDSEGDVAVEPLSVSRRDVEDTVRELPAYREMQRQRARETTY